VAPRCASPASTSRSVTLSYGLVAEQNIFQVRELTGGGQGQPAPKPAGFETDWRYYYLCLAFLAVVVWVDWRLMRTKGGRALLAVQENPRVAATFGVNVRLLTLFAFVLSGVFAGLGGALLAHNDTFVSPEVWSFNLALVFVIMTVVGGLRNRAGVVIGSRSSRSSRTSSSRSASSRTRSRRSPPLGADGRAGPARHRAAAAHPDPRPLPGRDRQQIRPLQRWLAGNRFDLHDHGPKEVKVADVRA
jgi:branched-chain amino acid transport system permease protein